MERWMRSGWRGLRRGIIFFRGWIIGIGPKVSGTRPLVWYNVLEFGAKKIEFVRGFRIWLDLAMTAAKVIEEILHLPREEQSRVLEFAFELARKRNFRAR